MIRERISRAIDHTRAVILAVLGRALLSCWSRTIRLRFVNREVPKTLEAAGRNFIYAFWHGRQFILFQAHRGSGVVIPASESRDGEIQARILKHFGVRSGPRIEQAEGRRGAPGSRGCPAQRQEHREARALGFLEEAFRSRGLRTDSFPVGSALRTG